MPWSTTQVACSPRCALDCAKKLTERAEKKIQVAERKNRAQEKREAREKVKTRAQWIKETETIVNRYIRLRDEKEPCISCRRYHTGQYHAGHYRPAGNHSALRFDHDNLHKQCAPCNNHKSGNLSEYRIYLINKIGIERVVELETMDTTKRWAIDELKDIIATHKKLIKELSK